MPEMCVIPGPPSPGRTTERSDPEETKGLRVSEPPVILDAQNPFRKTGPVRSGSSLLHEIRLAGLEPGGGQDPTPDRESRRRARAGSAGVPPPCEPGELEVFVRFQSRVGTRSARSRAAAVGRRGAGLRPGGSFADSVTATRPPDRGRTLEFRLAASRSAKDGGHTRAGPSSLLAADRPPDSTLLRGGSA